ncbi:MAG TPA: isoprenylcysteine carboxylmethyltransferase family protein [Sedimentisphaerales bacterium]|nr:isoprenylcysteine carboxylmethyltransferase family protein [Sedimentisphaerales bacterium]
MSFSMESVGYLFLLTGLIIRIWCSLYIGNRKSKEVVDQGPYSISRNPLYIGSFFLAIGVGLCFENWLLLLFVSAIIVPVHIITAKTEETNLELKFGEQYRMYKQRVPRFWPRFSNYNSPDIIEVNVNSIRRIAMDTVSILLLPQIEDLIELLHNHGIIPFLWHLPF